jgi:predicted ATPase
VADLIRACPSLQILATSREILHLSMECEFPVPPLALPELDRVQNPQTLVQYDAVAFFADRAQAARPDFAVTEDNAASVAAVCHRLDGLPLALELAAARTRLFPPQALLERLSHRLDLLTGGARDRPTRQQTLRNTIEWSYSLLSPSEQIFFARLSVFAGGCTLDAAEAVCNAEGDLPIAVLDGLASLVEKSLVRQGGKGEPRFGMLETVREYAAEKLEERGEAQEVRRDHAFHFLEFAEAIRPDLDGPGQIEGLSRLKEERNNLRAAMDSARDRGEVEVGLRLAIASEFVSFSGRGYQTEMEGWLETLLAVEGSEGNRVSPPLRAEALQMAALQMLAQGNAGRARALTEESVALIDALDNRRDVAYRLWGAGYLWRAQGDYARAVALLEEALPMFRELDDTAGLAVALVGLGDVARDQGDADRVIEACEESLRLCGEIGNREYAAYSLHNLGVAARMLGDLDRARGLFVEALELYRETGLVWDRAEMQASLAAVVRDLGDLDEAEKLLAEGLQQSRADAGAVEMTAMCLEGMAGVAAARGRAEYAATLFGAAHRVREETGTSIWPVNRPAYERDLEAVREALSAVRFIQAWEAGRAMTAEQAAAYVLDGTS